MPGNGQDWVIGHVVARDFGAGGDATLTVRGRSIDEPSGIVAYDQTLTVQLSLANTRVLARGSDAGVDADSINVGQKIMAFGGLSGTSLDAAVAGQGIVRMLRTRVFGIASGPAADSQLTLDLVRIGLRPVAQFDFEVDGNPQADENAFVVDTTGLAAEGVGARGQDRGARLPRGPSDSAAATDFDSVSLTNRSGEGKLFLAWWAIPSENALSPSPASIGVDVGASSIKAVSDGFGSIALEALPQPSLAPLTFLGVYRIISAGSVELHLSFADFSAALAQRIGPGSAVGRVSALGTFDATSQAFSALTATVVLR